MQIMFITLWGKIMAKFGKQSLRNLSTCHESLQLIMNKAIESVDFSVICGFRDEAKQNEAFNLGFSKLKWPKSKHNENPSLAVDVIPYPVDWNDVFRFFLMAGHILRVAHDLQIPLTWGGTWKSFPDYPHFQLEDEP
jgi:peptidoglycan L-alanyl-D-glutamate endopeptidase CwlK